MVRLLAVGNSELREEMIVREVIDRLFPTVTPKKEETVIGVKTMLVLLPLPPQRMLLPMRAVTPLSIQRRCQRKRQQRQQRQRAWPHRKETSWGRRSSRRRARTGTRPHGSPMISAGRRHHSTCPMLLMVARMRQVLAAAFKSDADGLFENDPIIEIRCPRCSARHNVTREAMEAYVASE